MSSRIIVSLRVKANPTVAFAVFTEEIGLWWQSTPLFAFTPRSPGRMVFEPPSGETAGRLIETLPNGKVFEIGLVRIWTPGERLVFGWRQATFRQDQKTEVEINFEAIGDETKVTVEHRGWDAVPQEHVARHGLPNAIFLRRHGQWWQALLKSFGRKIGGLS